MSSGLESRSSGPDKGDWEWAGPEVLGTGALAAMGALGKGSSLSGRAGRRFRFFDGFAPQPEWSGRLREDIVVLLL